MIHTLHSPFSLSTLEYKQYENKNFIVLLIVLVATFSIMLDVLFMFHTCFWMNLSYLSRFYVYLQIFVTSLFLCSSMVLSTIAFL